MNGMKTMKKQDMQILCFALIMMATIHEDDPIDRITEFTDVQTQALRFNARMEMFR
jgi:hypothetical protein